MFLPATRRIEYAQPAGSPLKGLPMQNPRPILLLILAFIIVFAGLTIAVIAESGLDILTVISLFILGMFGFGLVGALREPPE